MVENVAVLLDRCEVSRDGCAAPRRLKGKDGLVKGIFFREQVRFRRKPVPNRMSKLTSLWGNGYIRMCAQSGWECL